MSHTPGPWKVGGQFNVDVYAGDAIIAAGSFDQECRKVDTANAVLIAAAPALLEALQNLEDCATLVIERWERGDLADAVRSLVVDRNNARVAIRQAEAR